MAIRSRRVSGISAWVGRKGITGSPAFRATFPEPHFGLYLKIQTCPPAPLLFLVARKNLSPCLVITQQGKNNRLSLFISGYQGKIRKGKFSIFYLSYTQLNRFYNRLFLILIEGKVISKRGKSTCTVTFNENKNPILGQNKAHNRFRKEEKRFGI